MASRPGCLAGSRRRSQTLVVAQERNAVVLGKKTEHPWHRVHGRTQAGPEGGHFGNRVGNQLSKGLLDGGYSRRQGTPRSLEATGLHDSGRRVQTLRLDPRPTVEVSLQPLRANRPVGQSMRREDRDGQAARPAQIAHHRLPVGSLRIGVAPVMAVAMHRPRTTARTDRPRSSELIVSDLDAGQNPESSRPIKPPSSGHHGSSSPSEHATVTHSRSHLDPQLYNRKPA